MLLEFPIYYHNLLHSTIRDIDITNCSALNMTCTYLQHRFTVSCNYVMHYLISSFSLAAEPLQKSHPF